MLLQQRHRRIDVRHNFLWCSLLLVLPRFGMHETGWHNGLYEAAVILVVFPVIVGRARASRFVVRCHPRVPLSRRSSHIRYTPRATRRSTSTQRRCTTES